MDPVYKRVVLKISGEALAGEKHTGFDFDFVSKVCATVKKCAEMGVEVGIVIGGGNFWRGVKNGAPLPPANRTISPCCMYSMLFLVSYRSPTP